MGKVKYLNARYQVTEIHREKKLRATEKYISVVLYFSLWSSVA